MKKSELRLLIKEVLDERRWPTSPAAEQENERGMAIFHEFERELDKKAPVALKGLKSKLAAMKRNLLINIDTMSEQDVRYLTDQIRAIAERVRSGRPYGDVLQTVERWLVSVNPEYSGRMNVSFGAIKNAGFTLAAHRQETNTTFEKMADKLVKWMTK